ncbi:MAG: hypothetical protein GXO14_02440 [Thermococci archaeon]|nr:hypothetical protein [Thermococci archaeon]
MVQGYALVLISAIVNGFLSLFPLSVSRLAGGFGLVYCPMCTYAGVLAAVLYFFSSTIGSVLPSVAGRRITGEQTFFFYMALFTIVVGVPIVERGGGGGAAWSAYILIVLGVLIVLFARRAPLGRAIDASRPAKGSPTSVEGILTGIAQGLSFLGVPAVAFTYTALLLTGMRNGRAVRLMLMSLSVYLAMAMFTSPAPCIHTVIVKALYLIGAFSGALVGIKVLIKLGNTRLLPPLYGGLAVLMGVLLIAGAV